MMTFDGIGVTVRTYIAVKVEMLYRHDPLGECERFPDEMSWSCR